MYVQLGLADLKAQAKYEGDPAEGLNFDNDFAWGWGTRYTFHEQGNCRWGASVQMNFLDTSWDTTWTEDEPGFSETVKVEVDWETYDLLIAVGPTVDMGGWNLYGGPFYYYLSGDIDHNETETSTGGGLEETWKASGDLEADGIGGFVGAQFCVMEKANVTTEISFTGDGWAIGAGVAVPF